MILLCRESYPSLNTASGGAQELYQNLTGTWDVDLSCKGIDSGNTGKLKESSEVEIFDDGSGVVLVDWPGLFEFRAFLIPQAGKPDRGSLAGVNCDLSIDTLEGTVFTVDVKTKREAMPRSSRGRCCGRATRASRSSTAR